MRCWTNDPLFLLGMRRLIFVAAYQCRRGHAAARQDISYSHHGATVSPASRWPAPPSQESVHSLEEENAGGQRLSKRLHPRASNGTEGIA